MKFLKCSLAALALAAALIFGSCSAAPDELYNVGAAQTESSSETAAAGITEKTKAKTEAAEASEVSEDDGRELTEVSGEPEAEAVSQPASEGIAAESEESLTDPPAGAEKEYVSYKFRNKTLYNDHYKKHGAEFGDITKEEYLKLANDLINSGSEAIEYKYDDDGDLMMYDKDNNYFLVLSTDGYIRTFFRPSAGINYWNRQ